MKSIFKLHVLLVTINQLLINQSINQSISQSVDCLYASQSPRRARVTTFKFQPVPYPFNRTRNMSSSLPFEMKRETFRL